MDHHHNDGVVGDFLYSIEVAAGVDLNKRAPGPLARDIFSMRVVRGLGLRGEFLQTVRSPSFHEF